MPGSCLESQKVEVSLLEVEENALLSVYRNNTSRGSYLCFKRAECADESIKVPHVSHSPLLMPSNVRKGNNIGLRLMHLYMWMYKAVYMSHVWDYDCVVFMATGINFSSHTITVRFGETASLDLQHL